MKYVQLLVAVCCYSWPCLAQQPSLEIGDPVPPLRIEKWLKGKPIDRLEKGQYYVIEFWSSWCSPCRTSLAKLSKLADQFNNVNFFAVNILDNESTRKNQLPAFVERMGANMNYPVAVQEKYYMESGWFHAIGNEGIPKALVIDTAGRLAWAGHPNELPFVLPAVLNNKLNYTAIRERNRMDLAYKNIVDSVSTELFAKTVTTRDGVTIYDPKPMDMLQILDTVFRKFPALKHHPQLTFHQLHALLIVDSSKAIAFAQSMLTDSAYVANGNREELASSVGAILQDREVPSALLLMGAISLQLETESLRYTEGYNIPKRYKKMADWYARGGDYEKSKLALKKAINTSDALERLHDSIAFQRHQINQSTPQK